MQENKLKNNKTDFYRNKKIHTHHNYSKQRKSISKFIVFFIIIVVTIVLIFLIINYKKEKNTSKIFKIGNNTSSQEIVNYILNISSYDAQVEIEVKSNKNSNKYKIKQTYINGENNTQEILEPDNIQGVKITREGNKLKFENSKLNLTKIIEDYNELTQNNLDLISFVENYKADENSSVKEENNQIVMETNIKAGNKYQKYEKLYISKENGKPEKLEIIDANQNIIIYIIYNEININRIV